MQKPAPARLHDLRVSVNATLDRWLTARNVRRIAVANAVGMFLVVVFGMLVTLTGSGHGCGVSWPLCHGQFIPSHFAFQTAIEYNHRIGTPLETILVLVTAFGVWRLWGKRIEMKVLAIVMVLFLLAQAALGAAVVLFREPPELLAIHFGVSLTAFASTLLTAIFLYDMNAWDRLRDRVVPNGLRALIFGNAIFMYVVVYLGAYMDHKGLSLACRDWPMTCGSVFPGFAAGEGIVFAHRFGAAVLTVGIVAMVLWARQYKQSRPDLYRGSHFALGFVLLQALVGATVVFSQTNTLSELAHGGTAALLFGSLCYLALHALPRPRNVVAAERAGQAKQKADGGHRSPVKRGGKVTQRTKGRGVAPAPRG